MVRSLVGDFIVTMFPIPGCLHHSVVLSGRVLMKRSPLYTMLSFISGPFKERDLYRVFFSASVLLQRYPGVLFSDIFAFSPPPFQEGAWLGLKVYLPTELLSKVRFFISRSL